MKKLFLLLAAIITLLPLNGAEKSFEIVFLEGMTNGVEATSLTYATQIVDDNSLSLVDGYITEVDFYPVRYATQGGLLLLGDNQKEGRVTFNITHPEATSQTINAIGLKCARMSGNSYKNALISVGYTRTDQEFLPDNFKNLPVFTSYDEMEEIKIELNDPIDYESINSISLYGGVEGYNFADNNKSSAYVKSIVFYYNDNQKEQPEVKFTEDAFEASLFGFDPAKSPKAVTTPEGLELTYSIKDDAIATIDSKTGEITPINEGSTTVTASFAGNDLYEAAEATYTLKVVDKRTLPELSFSADEAIFYLGYSDQQLPELRNPEDLTVAFTSSMPDVAEVSDKGEVTPKAEGVTTITATFEGNDRYLPVEASYTLTVIPTYPEIQIEGKAVNSETYYIAPGQTINVKLVHPGTIYVKFERDIDTDMPFAPQKVAAEGFDEHDQTTGFPVDKPGTLSYYAEHGGKTFPEKSLKFVQSTDGIELVETDGSDARIFDLQGRPAADPAPGQVVVIVKNGKAIKSVVR